MTETAASANFRHEPERHRFVLAIGDAEAVLEYREVDARTLDYHHTFAPPAVRGGGIASQLTEHALQYALDHDLKVIPSCPFVATYVERHPRFRAAISD